MKFDNAPPDNSPPTAQSEGRRYPRLDLFEVDYEVTNYFCDRYFAAGSNTSSMHCGGLGTSYEYFGATPRSAQSFVGEGFPQHRLYIVDLLNASCRLILAAFVAFGFPTRPMLTGC